MSAAFNVTSPSPVSFSLGRLGTASVTRESIALALGDLSPNLSDNNFSDSEKFNVGLNTSARHVHLNKLLLDGISAADTALWNSVAQKASGIQLTITQKLISNLLEVSKGTVWDPESDTSSAYTLTVPEDAAKYAELNKIGGKSLVFNQLIENGNFASVSDWSKTGCNISANNNVLTATITSAADTVRIQTKTPYFLNGHKYFYTLTIKPPKRILMLINGQRSTSGTFTIKSAFYAEADSTSVFNGIFSPTTDGYYINIYFNRNEALAVNDVVEISNVMCIDLTQMFGAGNEPSTAAEFKAIFPNDYYAYTNGMLISGKCCKVVTESSNSSLIAEYPIPSAIQSLDGYGLSIGNVCNYVDLVNKRFVKRVAIRAYQNGDENDASLLTDKTNTVYPVSEQYTDLSEYLTDDNYIEVAPNGSVVFSQQNGTRLPIDQNIKYMLAL